MTANELHRQIAEFVAERFSESTSRNRARTGATPPDDCGPTFTRDLIARMAMARSGRNDSEQTAAERLISNGSEGARDEAREHATAPPVAPVQGAARFVLDLITPVGAFVSVIVMLIAVGFLVSDEKTEAAGVEIRAADAVPVDVKSSQPQNLFNEAMRSFSQVASGQLGVQVPGKTIRDVEKYFTDNGVGYAVRFPINALPLTGGIVSRYGGNAFAQLVYSSGAQAVYVIEVPVEELRTGKRLYVTDDVLARLEKGEKIQEMTAEGESLIMMRDGGLVITAVGNMEPAQLAGIVRAS